MTMAAARLHFFHALVFAGVLVILPGCGRKAEEAEPPAYAPVKWIEARECFIQEWTDVLGTTQPLPEHAARVTAAVEGRVLSVLRSADGKQVSEGQWVKKGDVIVQLDDRVARANRDKVEAAQEDLRQGISQAEFDVKLADIDLRRLQELDKQQPVGTRQLVTPIELEKARVALDSVRSKQRGAEVRVAAGAKELKALNVQLQLYTLTAPIDGRLGRILVMPGQTLAVGTPVAEVINIEEQIDVLCFVSPGLARKCREGQEGRIGTVDDMAVARTARPGEKKSPSAAGKVVYIADQAEIDTGNFAVKVRLPNKGLGVRGNTTLRMRILTNTGKACLTLEEEAIQRDQDPPTVIAVDNYEKKKLDPKDKTESEVGVARILNVKTGIHDHVLKRVEIISLEDPEKDPEKKWKGNLETARFVIEKGNGLRNGDLLKLEQEEEEEPAAAAKKEPEKKEKD